VAGAARAAVRARPLRLGAVALGFAASLAVFGPLHRVMGDAAASACGPAVVLAGLLLGQGGGLAAGLLCLPIHVLLLPALGLRPMPLAGHLVACGVLTATGLVVGRLRDLGALARRSHAELEESLRQARAAQQALAEREGQLALAQEVAGTGYLVSSGAGPATWSAELRTILGEPPAGAPPSLEAFLDRIHPEDRARILRQARRARAEWTAVQGDFRMVRPGGEVRWVHGRIRPMRDPAGGAVRLLGTVQDVTERRALQDQLAAAERLATVGSLAAGVAHEINNPLSSVVTNLGFLAQELEALGPALPGERADELAAAAGDALEGADRVRRIVRELMAFTRPGGAGHSVDLEPVLDRLLEKAAAQLRHRARLVKDFAGVPPARGDAAHVDQVFLNLLLNAAHSIPAGHPEAHEIRVTTRLEGPRVAVAVRDTGAGLTPEARRKVFEPGFDARAPGAGMGLGLAMSLGIVRAAGGDIQVESEPGQGSVFTVTLPVAVSAVADEEDDQASPAVA
jgi:signal transduction histidine kinase